MDGMNEKGLFCCVNMVTRENGYVTVGTNPGADQTLYASSVVRFLLDNCSSVDQACKMLADMNIVFIEALGEYHFLIADREQTVVAEIMDNKLVCKRPKADVLTNFYVLTDSFLENDDPGLLPSGLERYEYAVSHLSAANSVENTARLLESVKYSRLYDLQTSPYWYSDFYGYRCDGKTIDASTPKEEYTRFIEHKCELFASRRRDYTQAFWITTHSSVYDLENLTLRLYAQEDFTNSFDFVLR